ncbi:methylated-DNA-[protein]-cysteine S-methyltransferase [Kitasatospora sp. SolWspMP-SS2h]|uniref:methylated-DNA--[protein]-cysteine S-methyltransferase n=1 Tax=Kitasatospora sp. SolWspMP-SS2h TaxID=1305729 RepID=UPI000DBF6C71|nr:methylated-DNA--[protein]-cysteine S-methyltransferase [Kitasatospora sp. SolWspMP-SS2h]RAJ38343.1 methylated-DNA-[protein]-cysteine S-methyltransferase [Kitasatospora sp. SolWspMP-SS2h]
MTTRRSPEDPTAMTDMTAMTDCHQAELDTPVGRLVLLATDDALLACRWAPVPEERLRRAGLRPAGPARPAGHPVLHAAADQLDRYLDGRTREFTVPVDLRLGTDFGRRVLAALAGVGYGHTARYGELARAAGRPTAARAVGAALGANPVCVVLPCHRVIGSTGALTGYAGGIEAKRYLLELEARRAGAAS